MFCIRMNEKSQPNGNRLMPGDEEIRVRPIIFMHLSHTLSLIEHIVFLLMTRLRTLSLSIMNGPVL